MPSSKIQGPYRPAAIIRLQIRLEDFLNSTDPTVPGETGSLVDKLSTTKNQLKAAQKAKADAVANGGDVKATDLKVRNLQRNVNTLTKEQPQPSTYSRQAADIYSVEFVTVPLTAALELNSYRIPDTLEFTFAFKDVPLPDQIIRVCLVEFFSGEVAAEDFGTPQKWALPMTRKNLMFRGYADEWNVDNSDSDAKVSVKCRSIECVLYDAKINPLAKVYQVQDAKGARLTEEPIDEYVNRILRQFPATSGGTGGDALRAVMYKAASAPKLSRAALIRTLQTAKSTNAAAGSAPGQPGVIPAAPPAGGTAAGQTAGNGTPQIPQPVPAEMTAWQLITQACQMVGMKIVYDPSIDPQATTGLSAAVSFGAENFGTFPKAGDVLLIMPLAVIYDTQTGDIDVRGGAPDGFSRDFSLNGASPKSSTIRIFVWGRNVKTQKTRRKLGRIKAPAVQVQSYNPDGQAGGRTIVAQFPTKKMINAMYAKGDGKIQQVEIRQIKDGIRDQNLLQQIAVSLYHEMGRQELQCTLETDEMASYYDPTIPGQRNADVLTLRPATPVKIMVAKDTVQPGQGIRPTPLQSLYAAAPTELRAALLDQNRKFNPQLSDDQLTNIVEAYLTRIATSINSARMTDVFYTQTVRHNWSFEDGEGWSAEIIVSNYVEARALPANISTQDQTINQQQNPANTTSPENHAKAVDAQAQARVEVVANIGLGNVGLVP